MEDLIIEGVKVAGEVAQGFAGSGGNRRRKNNNSDANSVQISEAEREKQRQLDLLKNSKTYTAEEWAQKQYETSTSPLKSEKKRDRVKKGAKKLTDKAKATGVKAGQKVVSAGSKTADAGKSVAKATREYIDQQIEKDRKRQAKAKERRKQKMADEMQSEEYRQFLEYKKTVADAESEVAVPRKRRQTTKRNTSTKKSDSTPRTSTKTSQYPRWSAKFEDYFDPEDEEYLGTTRARQLAIERYYKRHGGTIPTESAKNRQSAPTKSAKNRKSGSAKRTTSSRSKKGAASKKGRSQIEVWANSDNWL